ncbi:MAG TPA: rhodanese-like domain-containing protein [Chitinophagaceae bacterium]|nr:rhodanese-like domain-containing protein [Chitinophagaceae bacterium]HNU15032.1 rhodanese-like domain-containing protein [Chitinophagaceae bacterium]
MQIITVEELKARMDAGEKLNLIDCREPQEYAEYNIGAKLIPLGQIQAMQIDEIENLKEEEILIHCRSGQRSMVACMFLETLGFKNTKNVAGGILAWQEKFGK